MVSGAFGEIKAHESNEGVDVQILPFDNGEHHSPHVGGAELLKKPVTKEQKVPGVFYLDLACGRNSVQC